MTFLALILFIVAGAGTPGPNNTIAMASGTSFGFRKTLPAIIGINIGFPTMIMVLGLGMGQILRQWPLILDVIQPLGVAYLLWLAWRIATGPTDIQARREGRPPGLIQMALFQFVNPKAWTLALAAISTFTGFWDSFFLEVVVVAGFTIVFATPCTMAWTALGVGAGRVITRPRHLRIFNLVMAALLVFSVLPAVQDIAESLKLLLR